MISLAQLHSQLGSDLRPAAGGAVAVRQISGVHISELDDPTPYLEGGELLLTTGIPVSGGEAKVQAYVRRLVERNIAALGLGLGAGVDEVPPALSAACGSAGLELLVVPDGTPFMNVSRAYWDLVGREGQADLTASLGTQTALAVRNSTINGLPQTTINITMDGVNIQDNTTRSNPDAIWRSKTSSRQRSQPWSKWPR